MAQYRLAAQVIGRSSGRSATAAAAYRAGARIEDARTGLVHDYTRKTGVTHAEIIAPDNAPDWMRDRAQLWNAVEIAEKRRDAQLAREIQLSLPHELTETQRIALVRGFVREELVADGMIADIAVHAPDPGGDARNHHAHIMLTLRTLTGDGFGNKARDWNDPARLQGWREAWADHQNRAFERLGLPARVDHRSLDAQGIDREPQKHLGPVATEIERDGRASHRGDENREINRRNGVRLDLAQAANDIDRKIDFEQRKFEAWAAKKHVALDFDARQRRAQFEVGLAARMEAFDRAIEAEFRAQKTDLSTAKSAIEARLEATGWRKFVRDITLTTRRDRRALETLERDAAAIDKAEAAKRAAQAQAEENRQRALDQEIARRRAALEKGVEKAREDRTRNGWAGRSEPIRSGFAARAEVPPPRLREEFNRAASPQEASGRAESRKAGEEAARQTKAAREGYKRADGALAAGTRSEPPPASSERPAPANDRARRAFEAAKQERDQNSRER